MDLTERSLLVKAMLADRIEQKYESGKVTHGEPDKLGLRFQPGKSSRAQLRKGYKRYRKFESVIGEEYRKLTDGAGKPGLWMRNVGTPQASMALKKPDAGYRVRSLATSKMKVRVPVSGWAKDPKDGTSKLREDTRPQSLDNRRAWREESFTPTQRRSRDSERRRRSRSGWSPGKESATRARLAAADAERLR